MRRAKSYAGTMLALSWHEPGKGLGHVKAPSANTSGTTEGPRPPPLLEAS